MGRPGRVGGGPRREPGEDDSVASNVPDSELTLVPKVAHVVFASDSVTLAKPLAKALPNKPFNQISLNDASPESAIQYIESKLAEAGGTEVLSDESRPHVYKVCSLHSSAPRTG